jgi:hypothetical protein
MPEEYRKLANHVNVTDREISAQKIALWASIDLHDATRIRHPRMF